jgi:hypothetical protein
MLVLLLAAFALTTALISRSKFSLLNKPDKMRSPIINVGTELIPSCLPYPKPAGEVFRTFALTRLV